MILLCYSFSFLVLQTVFQSHILVKCHHQESDNHQSVADNLEAAQLLLQTGLELGMAWTLSRRHPARLASQQLYTAVQKDARVSLTPEFEKLYERNWSRLGFPWQKQYCYHMKKRTHNKILGFLLKSQCYHRFSKLLKKSSTPQGKGLRFLPCFHYCIIHCLESLKSLKQMDPLIIT